MPDSMTQILSSGPPGTKVKIAVLGDGFADGADQTIYNNKVNDLLLNGLFVTAQVANRPVKSA